MRKRDYYAVLGVGSTATVQEIREAYRRLAREYSPDVNLWDTHAAALFAEISEAYRVLRAPGERAVYDRRGHQAMREQPVQSQQGRGTLQGDSVHVPVDLSFEDAIRGVTINVEVRRLSPCQACDASGAWDGAPALTCLMCWGSGVVLSEPEGAPGRCPACDGIGERVNDPCPECRGRGVALAAARILVTIPPGVDTGAQLRLPGEGHSGPFGGPRGDLIVSTRVALHQIFTRKGDNLYCEVPVTISEAVLGATITVPTPDGAAVMSIPTGTQSGQIFRLRGKGVVRLNGNGRGDLYVTCRVEIPRKVDARAQELFREIERLMADNPRQLFPAIPWGRTR